MRIKSLNLKFYANVIFHSSPSMQARTFIIKNASLQLIITAVAVSPEPAHRACEEWKDAFRSLSSLHNRDLDYSHGMSSFIGIFSLILISHLASAASKLKSKCFRACTQEMGTILRNILGNLFIKLQLKAPNLTTIPNHECDMHDYIFFSLSS